MKLTGAEAIEPSYYTVTDSEGEQIKVSHRENQHDTLREAEQFRVAHVAKVDGREVADYDIYAIIGENEIWTKIA